MHAELVRTIEGLHDLNLQRADRVKMAHGLEARVSFLELNMVSLSLSLPAEWKLVGADQPEKRLLRLAFDGWLPDDFLWRKKAQFGDGSGAASVLQRRMAESVTEEEFERERHEVETPCVSRGGRLLSHLRRRPRRGPPVAHHRPLRHSVAARPASPA